MSNQTFLPEDYIAQKAERRTNIICLALFVIVMVSVFGAFLWTNGKWTRVKSEQRSINVKYEQAAAQIEKLNKLDDQKDQMVHKAELAAALVERVPRSILLAELINRMPPRLGLLSLQLSSEKMKPKPTSSLERGKVGNLQPMRGITKSEAMAMAPNKVDTPRYQCSLVMVGVAPTDLEVSEYLSKLTAYPLLTDVQLKYSEMKNVEGREMREFSIMMKLDPDADVRVIDPLAVPRELKNPMIDTIQFGDGNK